VPIWLTFTRIELADPFRCPGREALRIGDEQIVANQLTLSPIFGQRVPAIPVVFGHAVFDGNDRVVGARSARKSAIRPESTLPSPFMT
jgi:hypothetical protein